MVNPKTVKLVFAVSPKLEQRLVDSKSEIMYPSRAICLPTDCCFSELAL